MKCFELTSDGRLLRGIPAAGVNVETAVVANERVAEASVVLRPPPGVPLELFLGGPDRYQFAQAWLRAPREGDGTDVLVWLDWTMWQPAANFGDRSTLVHWEGTGGLYRCAYAGSVLRNRETGQLAVNGGGRLIILPDAAAASLRRKFERTRIRRLSADTAVEA